MKDNNTLIFVHIPKTAGSTFTSFLENQFEGKKKYPLSWGDHFNGINRFESLPLNERNAFRLIYAHQRYGNHKYIENKPTYITFLRNPVERMWSHFYFLGGIPDKNIQGLLARLDDKTSMFNNIPRYWLFNNFQTRWLSNAIFGKVFKSDSDMLLEAISNLSKMEVGLTECFDESISYFYQKFGWQKQELKNQKVNSESKSQLNDLSDEYLEKLENNVQLDTILYQFAVNKFLEQINQ